MIGTDDLQDRPSFYLAIFYVYDFYVFYYIWNMRLLLNIEQIAKELGLECWNESGFVNVRIGMADWDGTGIETDMVIRYYHGPYTDEWGHTAMKREEFQIYYQPKHDARTGRIVGAEALVRWTHPEFGFLSPAEFIPVFEQTGFISEVDFYAWKRTCQNQRKWQERGLHIVPISVNCSRSELLQNDFLRKWFKPIKHNNLFLMINYIIQLYISMNFRKHCISC